MATSDLSLLFFFPEMIQDVIFTWQDIFGVTALAISAVLQLSALFITRIIVKLKPGISLSCFIRSWIHGIGFLEQTAFLIFHVTYILPWKDWDDVDLCIILRGTMSMMSCCSVMWLLMLAAFYYRLARKLTSCFCCNSRKFSVSITWTLALASSLLYLIVTFLMQDYETYSHYVAHCWNHINGTLHLYVIYGGEMFPFSLLLLCVLSTCILERKRGDKAVAEPLKRQISFRRMIIAPEELKHLAYKVDLLLFLAVLLGIYYIGFVLKLSLSEAGSDVSLMCMQAIKGVLIATTVCILDKNTLALFGHQNVATQQEYRVEQESLAVFTYHSEPNEAEVVDLQA